jgi:hypothetical protein
MTGLISSTQFAIMQDLESLVPSVYALSNERSTESSEGNVSDPKIGIGGGPTRATTLPNDAAGRKEYPVASGVLDYFADAIVAVSHVSYLGNEQHNPGQPLHWARGKSTDESDTIIRHFLQRGTLDTDGQRHSAKLAWRALALLQKEIEADQQKDQQKTPYSTYTVHGDVCSGTSQKANQ